MATYSVGWRVVRSRLAFAPFGIPVGALLYHAYVPGKGIVWQPVMLAILIVGLLAAFITGATWREGFGSDMTLDMAGRRIEATQYWFWGSRNLTFDFADVIAAGVVTRVGRGQSASMPYARLRSSTGGEIHLVLVGQTQRAFADAVRTADDVCQRLGTPRVDVDGQLG